MTFNDWCNTWISVWCSRLRPTTIASYRSIQRLYLSPLLGAQRLDAVTSEDIQTAIDLILDTGHGRTAELAFDVLRACFRRAVRARHLLYSPVDAVEPPKFDRRAVSAIPCDILPVFTREAVKQPLWPAFALMLYAGLRRGEVIGLRWRDIDMAKRVIHVRQSVVSIDGHLQPGQTKSAAGCRDIPMIEPLPQILQQRRAAALRAGCAGADRPVIVSARSNGYITPSGLQSALRRIQQRSPQLTDITLHALRHTYATQMLAKGVNIKTLQYILGHSNSRLTLDTYCSTCYNSVADDFARCGLA